MGGCGGVRERQRITTVKTKEGKRNSSKFEETKTNKFLVNFSNELNQTNGYLI